MKNKSCDNQGAPRMRGARQRGVPLMPMLNPEDVLPADHLVRGIWLSVRGLDWTAYENGIRARGATPGRRALDPRVLGTLWVWAIWQGVDSARQLAERCKTDLACLWVLAGEKTNHHTLSDFLRQDTVELDKRMAETVWALHRKAKVSFNTLLVDGTKIDARASKQSFHKEKDLRAAVLRKLSELRSSESGENARQQAARERAKREVIEGYEAAAKMLKSRQAAVRSRGSSHEERAANMKVSLTDAEARMMRRTDGGTRSSVNIQVGIDAASGAVLYTDATDRANDYGLAVPALEGTKQNCGRYPRQLSADGGYTDLPSAAACFALGVPFMVPPRPARNPKTRPGRLDAAMLSVEKMWREEWEKSGASTKRVRMRVERVIGSMKRRGMGRSPGFGLAAAGKWARWHAVTHNILLLLGVRG